MYRHKHIHIYKRERKRLNSNQASDGGAALEALSTVLGHGFATGQAQSQVLAIASVQVRGRSATTTRRLQQQIERHGPPPSKKNFFFFPGKQTEKLVLIGSSIKARVS